MKYTSTGRYSQYEHLHIKYFTNRALGSEVWVQGETDEDTYQVGADEDI